MSNVSFDLITDYQPTGDQPNAITKIVEGYLKDNKKIQTLHGVTGSGKTFTASQVIKHLGKPTLVIAPNKTLAAQLYAEFKQFFPNNAVEYFVSFYDYYQPESYLPTKDLYISKDFNINDEIEKLRNSATKALSERRDVIIVASVSCIYNVGMPETYRDFTITIKKGMELERDAFLSRLVEMQYRRNEMDFKAKTFRAKGDRVEIKPIYQEEGIRVEFFGDEIERISIIDPTTGARVEILDELTIYPSTQYLTREEQIQVALKQIRDDLRERVDEFEKAKNYVAAERIIQRTNYDLEQLEELGHCSGIENYSRYFDGRNPGDPPYSLIDHFPDDFFLVVDESHVTLPQIRGMYGGDFSRKQNLINYGFRLPSAYDNRPLRWEEFEKRMPTTLFVSATPADYEHQNSQAVVEQIIRPTGLVDPVIDVRPSENQVDDLMNEIDKRIHRKERVLVTTLTKRMAEDLSDYFAKSGLKSQYMHSDIDTLERVQILRSLRTGEVDVLVGINLLREGLDLPEVSLVAILDADKQGFLRSSRSLIQIMGRAARNVDGTVLLYADSISDAMREAITENNRRRKIQLAYNKKHGITPKTIVKGFFSVLETLRDTGSIQLDKYKVDDEIAVSDLQTMILELTEMMNEAADNLEFELAAELRDKIKELKELLVIERNK
ncbi:MAG: excinuclease ABC subunit UvrB [Candidatus Heimdallarchaeota archaeon]|nr:excinuclease ABC subunit UvrB [Candidatus Heimdallarchaeota archaeon]